VIDSVNAIRDRCGIEVQSNDWAKLASLPPDRQQDDVQELFFPGSNRRRDFLANVDRPTYNEMLEYLIGAPQLKFPDVHALLKTTKQEGRTMSLIVSHVGQWLNRDPAKVGEREGNKPPLRNDFLPALREKYGDGAELQSVQLQQNVLAYTRQHMAEFTDPTIEHYLNEYPSAGVDVYGKRFEYAAWKGLIFTVYATVGPHFQSHAVSRFNVEEPTMRTKPTSTIARAICNFLPRIPEVAGNPALKDEEAVEALFASIQPMVLDWAAKQCDTALAKRWPRPTTELLKEELAKYRTLGSSRDQLTASPDHALDRAASDHAGSDHQGSPDRAQGTDHDTGSDLRGSPGRAQGTDHAVSDQQGSPERPQGTDHAVSDQQGSPERPQGTDHAASDQPGSPGRAHGTSNHGATDQQASPDHAASDQQESPDRAHGTSDHGATDQQGSPHRVQGKSNHGATDQQASPDRRDSIAPDRDQQCSQDHGTKALGCGAVGQTTKDLMELTPEELAALRRGNRFKRVEGEDDDGNKVWKFQRTKVAPNGAGSWRKRPVAQRDI